MERGVTWWRMGKSTRVWSPSEAPAPPPAMAPLRQLRYGPALRKRTWRRHYRLQSRESSSGARLQPPCAPWLGFGNGGRASCVGVWPPGFVGARGSCGFRGVARRLLQAQLTFTLRPSRLWRGFSVTKMFVQKKTIKSIFIYLLPNYIYIYLSLCLSIHVNF